MGTKFLISSDGEKKQLPLITGFLYCSGQRPLTTFSSREGLLDLVKKVVTPNVVNAIHCKLSILAHTQDKLVKQFPVTIFKIWAK